MIQKNETSLGYRGWRVVILCFTLAFFSSGLAYYGQSIYLAELQRLYGWTAFTISTANTASFFLSAILEIFVGDTITKFGSKRFLLIGVICFGISLILIGQINASWQLYPTYLLMSVGWACMNLVTISTIIALWFKSKRGLALSLSLNGASFGGVVCAPILLIAVRIF